MTGSRCFLDTNVLVYAHDSTAGDRRDQARSLVDELWDSGQGCLSVQVLQEFFVVVTRKVPRPLDMGSAELVVSDLSRWRVHAPGPQDVLGAIELHRRTGVSFWDAMVLRSAAQLRCEVVYSEDLRGGEWYDRVQVRNPFSPGGAT